MSRRQPFLLAARCFFVLLLCTAGLMYVMYIYIPYARFPFQSNINLHGINSGKYDGNWEQLTHNDPVLKDWKSCASSYHSIIYMKRKKPFYETGDVVKVDIIVKDHYGRRKVTGGDMIRIWVEDQENDACAAGYVNDNDDGSYQGVVKLLWVGNVTIVARVATPRELVRLLFHRARTGTSPEQMVGKFKHGRVSKVTNCSPMEETSRRYWNTCTLTHKNSDLSWYCEKPHNMSCEDWTENTYVFVEANFTSQEQQLLQSLITHGNMKTVVELVVKLKSNTDRTHNYKDVPNLVACNSLLLNNTWESLSPVGFMYRGRWNSTQCRSTFDGSKEAYTRCLKGKKLWLFGDSTTRQFFSYFQTLLKLQLKTEKWSNPKWIKPSTISNTNGTISVFWGPHALPYKTSITNDSLFTKGTHLYIDSIPANSKDIVVVYHYLHYNTYHPVVVRSHIRKTAESVKALKERAPDVKVVVKGPHAYKIESLGIRYDFWGVIYEKIFKEEFKHLIKDVIYLNLWDITVATESIDRHPNHPILRAIINNMMAYVCP